MSAEKITIAKLDINTDDLLKRASDTKKSIDELAKKQRELTKAGEGNTVEFVKNEAELKKLRAEYGQQTKAVSALIAENGQLLTAEKALETALNAEVKSINDANKQNAELKRIRNEVNVTTDEGRKAYEEINKKISENDAFIKSNVSALEQQKIGIGGYKDSILEAIKEQGIFNGGLQQFGTAGEIAKIGFEIVKKEVDNVKASFGQSTATIVTNTASTISNTGATEARTAAGFQQQSANQAQTASTTTLTTATNAQTASVGLGTKAWQLFRLALLATGIGAFVVVLGSLIAFLATTQKGVDAVTSVLRPLQAIGQSLIGVLQVVGEKFFNAFSNPKQALIDLVNLIKDNLLNRLKAFAVILDGVINRDFSKIQDGFLQAATGVENLTDKIGSAAEKTGKFFNDAIKTGQELDRLEKQLRATRLKNTELLGEQEELLKAQNRIAEDQTKPLAEREKAAQKSIEIAREINRLKSEELNLEIAILENKQSRNDTSAEELQELAELRKRQNEFNAQTLEIETTQQNKLNGIRKEANAKAEADRKSFQENLIKEQNAQLELFKAQQGIRVKDLQDQLIFEQEVSKKRLAILKTEFEAGKKSKTEFEAEKLNIENEFLQKQVKINLTTAERLVNQEIARLEKTKGNKKLISDVLLNEEVKRLEAIAKLRRDFEAKRLAEGVITETQYQDAINGIKDQFQTAKDEAQAARQQAETEKKKIDLENRRAIEDITFQEDLIILQDRLEKQRLIEVAAAEQTGADIALINQKYKLKKEDLEKREAEMERIASLNRVKNRLEEFKRIGAGLESLFGENKAFASATALINGGLAVTEILKTPSTLPEPAASISRGVQIAGVIATTGRSIAQINSAKFEKGGLMEIGGKRHSQGGTKFVGEDGTRFEAEKGEMIGVLNRGASEVFMKFNNQFGNGQVGTTFAENGGIISRSIDTTGNIDIDRLAQTIASLPNPIVYVEELNAKQNLRNEIITIADF